MTNHKSFAFSNVSVGLHIICFFFICVTATILIVFFDSTNDNQNNFVFYKLELVTAISVIISEFPLVIIVYTIMRQSKGVEN